MKKNVDFYLLTIYDVFTVEAHRPDSKGAAK